ncbi:MAG TPA: hypothetical protein VK177_21275 [Flavobacteriales bacterium]|nr:hypothetical protein [Flavobacteriales bacterium]
MPKANLIFAFTLFLAACGGSKKQEEKNTDTLPVTDTSLIAAEDTIAMDTSVEKPIVEVEKHWDNPATDIPVQTAMRIDNLVWTTVEKSDGDEMERIHDYINKKNISKLTANELVYYVLTYPASFSQNCSFDEYHDTTNTPKIVRYFADSYGEAARSALQFEALEAKRDSVILVLNKFIGKHPGKTDPQYLTILRDLMAIESIPAVAKAATAKCPGNFTLMVNLMERENYEPFKTTEIYQHMFGDNQYQYGARVEATEENMKEIKRLALQFYKENKK